MLKVSEELKERCVKRSLVEVGHFSGNRFNSHSNAMQEGGENHIRPQEFFPALPHPPTSFLFPSTVLRGKWRIY
jgi:hypothetical protein